MRTGECTHTLKGHTGYVWSVAFDGTAIVSGSEDWTVRIWRAPYNTAECERVIVGHTESVNRVWLCTAPNEHIVVSAEYNFLLQSLGVRTMRVHVHDIRTGDSVCEPIEHVDCKLS